MKKKVYIHIGANKTGTTSIQSFMNTNNSLLNTYGLHYCSIGKLWDGHFPLSWELGAGSAPTNYKSEGNLWEKVKEEIKARPENSFLISSENFILLKDIKKLNFIKDVLSDFDTYIIMYIRRQDLWVESLYLQAIKMGINVKDFLTFSKRPGQNLDYLQIIQPWEEVFGEKNILVHSFDNQDVKSNLIIHFLSILNLNIDDLKQFKYKFVNESLTREIAEFLLVYNKYFKQQQRSNIINFYNKYLKNEKSLNTKFFNKDERIKFLQRFEESNTQISKKYFHKNTVFDMVFPDYESKESYSKKEIQEMNEKLIGLFFNQVFFSKQ